MTDLIDDDPPSCWCCGQIGPDPCHLCAAVIDWNGARKPSDPVSIADMARMFHAQNRAHMIHRHLAAIESRDTP